MAPVGALLIPPERQSARIRQKTSEHSSQSSASAQYDPRTSTRGTRQSTRDKALASVPAQAPVTEEDDEENDEGEDSDGDDGVTFKTKTKLPTPVVAKWRLGDMLPLIDTEWLDLDPEYQRDVVWGASGMTGLINSIIGKAQARVSNEERPDIALTEEYYIPPIIFNLQVLETHEGYDWYKRICVDGKQRITSCYLFTQGDIPCTDRYGKKWWYSEKLDDNGRPIRREKRRILSEDMKRVFNSKEFVCYEYKDLTPEQEEDLFARVQKGVQLSAAEKLHATTGPWQSLAKRFEQDFMSVINLSKYKRSQGFRTLLSTFAQIIEVQYPSRDDGKPLFKSNIPGIQNLCKKGQLCNESIKAHLTTVFQIFDDLIQMDSSVFENNSYKIARSFAPVEMIAVACLISKYHDTRNHDLLLGDIRAMRQQLREALPSLRIDSVEWKTIWQFIDELESYRGRPGSSVSASSRMMLPGSLVSRGPVFQSPPIRGRVAQPQGSDPYRQSSTETGTASHLSTRSPTGDSARETTVSSRTTQESSYPPHPRQELLHGQAVHEQNTMTYPGSITSSLSTSVGKNLIKTEEGSQTPTTKRRTSGLDLGPRSSTAAALAAKRYKPSHAKNP